MPSPRTNLTLISSVLLLLGSVSVLAETQAPALGEGYITAQESVGLASPLRQTARLDPLRLKAVIAEAAPRIEIAAVVPQVNAKQSAWPAADVVVNPAMVDPIIPVAAKLVQSNNDAVNRVMDLYDRGMLSPELATDLLSKLGAEVPPAVMSALRSPGADVTVPAALIQASPAASSAQPEASPLVVAALASPKTSTPQDVEALASPVVPAPADAAAPYSQPRVEPIQLAAADTPSIVVAPAIVTPVAADNTPGQATVQGWSLARDDRTIRTSLERWSRDANWQLAWEYPTDFQVEFDAKFDGDFIDAVSRVMDGLSAPDRPIRAEFYFGNRVLRVVSGRE